MSASTNCELLEKAKKRAEEYCKWWREAMDREIKAIRRANKAEVEIIHLKNEKGNEVGEVDIEKTEAERDAAIKRAEKAEKERDEARKLVDHAVEELREIRRFISKDVDHTLFKLRYLQYELQGRDPTRLYEYD